MIQKFFWKNSSSFFFSIINMNMDNHHHHEVNENENKEEDDVEDDDDDGVYPEIVDQRGQTYLHRVIIEGTRNWLYHYLVDPDVNTTRKDNNGCTPFWLAAQRGVCDLINIFVALGRDLGDLTEKGMEIEHLHREVTPLELAVALGHTEAAALIRRLMKDENQTRHEVRLYFQLQPQSQDHLFSLVVFLSEGLLTMKTQPNVMTRNQKRQWNQGRNTRRFFGIASQLPMELQMLLCNRAGGSMKQLILTRDSEPMFKYLVCKMK